MTKKIFYEDSMIRSFEGTVLSCEKAEEGYRIELDRTAFFPEGGGQYGDTGKFLIETENRKISIKDTQETGERIYHYTDQPVEVGTRVTGILNFEERFSKMQQHTGEHIVSGLVNSHFGYNNVGFHLGRDSVTMDYDGPLTKEQIRSIEREANEIVAKDLPIEVLYPDPETLASMTYRSKIEIEGQVRIVRIPGCDTCACCAPHVKSTGSVGIIKITNAIRYKGGVRLHLLCGLLALEDYNRKEAGVMEISNMLSAKQEEIVSAVVRLQDEITSCKEKIKRLQEQYLRGELAKINNEKEKVLLFEEELDPAAVRHFINTAMEQTGGICGAFVGNDETGYRYVIGTKNRDINKIAKELNQTCHGKGGGKPPMVQGSLSGKRIEIESFFEKI